MDDIDLYIMLRDVLNALRVVNIEGRSPEMDKPTLMYAWAFLERVAKEVSNDNDGSLSLTANFGSEEWDLTLRVTLETQVKDA
jgi:hypothetical protein